MARWQFPIIDCDGHLVESIPELVEFMGPGMRQAVLDSGRESKGFFALSRPPSRSARLFLGRLLCFL